MEAKASALLPETQVSDAPCLSGTMKLPLCEMFQGVTEDRLSNG